MLGACAAVLVLAFIYSAACALSGENLVAAWFDELSLRRADLASLDAACAANPRSSGLVVTLTTIPSRTGALELTLKSLLRQSARPSQIRLCLPAWSERERCAYSVPERLLGLKCVALVSCTDEGPATKFLSTLHAVGPDQAVVVVDDDRAYHRRLLEAYALLAAAHPREALAGAGWIAPSDLIDRPTTLKARLFGAPHVPLRANQIRRASRVDIVQGMHSYLIRPAFFNLDALGDFAGAPEAIKYVDDVWVSAHCRAEKWLHPISLPFTDYLPLRHRRLARRTSLGRCFNRAPRDDDRANSIALKYFKDCWKA